MPTAEKVVNPPCIAFFANTSWYLVNFRLGFIRSVRELGFRVIVIAPEDSHSRVFEAAGIPWYPVALRRREYNPLTKIRTVRQVRRIYREQAVRLAHHFTLESIIIGTSAARFEGGPGVVQSVTGLGIAFSARSRSWRMVRKGILPFLQRALPHGPVIVENRVDERKVERILGNAPGRRIRRIAGGGVDTDRFVPTGPQLLEREAGDTRIRFLLAGRLLREKGAALFAAAAERMDPSRHRFLLAGEPDPGNPDSYTEADIRRWCEAPGFEWLGNVSDMPGLLRSVDVLVHPTFYGEGLPRILMEGASCGLPLVGSTIAGCVEIVREGENGWRLRRKDPDELAALLTTVAECPEARQRYGIRSREIAVAEYSEKAATRRTLELYRETGIFDRTAGERFLDQDDGQTSG